ncbi:hypothetical protein PTTG_26113 [Puccinia triticina 1-1 BBBD Race 1]|uniref:Secreted protein n=2 Tax=Puccinia triticina TaxID=208348 RepID=A0A180GY40_PUCT1|nr:uncharacterized protein PtA15_17A164 [Puccinia triticina]OAV97289.1 hypothetical protein PTTG_26113 [Puccinia triticina 1-1 BBBD Race 1]WAQ92682.1 hypothetical protein PtA15_17A164 [Puccinia triticina]WAR63575.1 hypothetical protein PtB15_17B175 [Puccinia triticina]
MHVFKLALPFFAVVCGFTRGARIIREPHVLCTGKHPRCFCAVDARNFGPTATWAVVGKCRHLGDNNFVPCDYEPGYPGFPPQNLCCDEDVMGRGDRATKAVNEHCIMRDPR